MMWIFDGVCCFAVEMSRRYCIHWFDRFVRLISKLCLVQNKVYLCGFTWSFIQQTPKCNLFSLVRSLSWKGSCIMYYSSLCYTYKSPLHCATVTRGKDWLESVAWPKWLQCVCNDSDAFETVASEMVCTNLQSVAVFKTTLVSQDGTKDSNKTTMRWSQFVWTHRNFTLNSKWHICLENLLLYTNIIRIKPACNQLCQVLFCKETHCRWAALTATHWLRSIAKVLFSHKLYFHHHCCCSPMDFQVFVSIITLAEAECLKQSEVWAFGSQGLLCFDHSVDHSNNVYLHIYMTENIEKHNPPSLTTCQTDNLSFSPTLWETKQG